MQDSIDAILAQRHPRPTRRFWHWRDLGTALAIGVAVLLVAYLLKLPDGASGQGWAVSVAGAPSSPAPAVGQPAPLFEAKGLDGAPVRLADLRGRPVWVNFFATWCPPCRAENPDIEATYREYQAAGSDLAIVSLSMGEDEPTVRDYVRKTGLTYTIGLDSSTLIAASYRVTGLPTHVFIDRAGVVRSIRVGGLQRDMMRAELAKIH